MLVASARERGKEGQPSRAEARRRGKRKGALVGLLRDVVADLLEPIDRLVDLVYGDELETVGDLSSAKARERSVVSLAPRLQERTKSNSLEQLILQRFFVRLLRPNPDDLLRLGLGLRHVEVRPRLLAIGCLLSVDHLAAERLEPKVHEEEVDVRGDRGEDGRNVSREGRVGDVN